MRAPAQHRAFRDEIERSYDRAGSDSAFQAEMERLNLEYAGTLLDGLDESAPAD